MRTLPNIVVRRRSQHQSERRAGVKTNLIVIHTTEGHNRPGNSDLLSLASWFTNPSAKVSSHVATDGDGNSARFVGDRSKAWHCAAYNSPSLGIEQIGSYKDSAAEWKARLPQLQETARWLAYWSKKFGIPLRHAAMSNGVVTRSGVTTHSALGSLGGNHGDPGAAFPIEQVLSMARAFRDGKPVPTKPPPVKPPGSRQPTISLPKREGDTGTAVKKIQERLNQLGAKPRLVVDGKFGVGTERAVKAFQRKHPLTVDGVVGSRTWNAMWRK